MTVHELATQIQPETHILNSDSWYPTDAMNDPYLPLSHEVAQPLPFDESRPGNGIMIHFMDAANEDNASDKLGLIREQGFYSPRRFATFSTKPMGWVSSERTSVLVFRTFTRWSREYGENGFSVWRENIIGIPESDVIAKSPQVVNHHRQRRLARPELGWDIWSYTPPTHLLGVVNFYTIAEARDFEAVNYTIWKDYQNGLVDEIQTIKLISEARKYLPVEGLRQNLTEEEREEFWLCYTAALTENALLELIFNEVNVSHVHPYFPWTKTIHAKAQALLVT